jgi:hypothetical protein
MSQNIVLAINGIHQQKVLIISCASIGSRYPFKIRHKDPVFLDMAADGSKFDLIWTSNGTGFGLHCAIEPVTLRPEGHGVKFGDYAV